MPEKRSCSGTTKKGAPCRNAAVTEHDLCIAHLPREEREALGFGGSQPGSGRKPNPKPTEVLRQRVEAEIEKWLAPYEEGLQAVQGVVVGTGPKATLEVMPDFKTRMAAATSVLDRVYGRPKQTTELTGEGGGPIETRELVPSDADFNTQVAQVLDEAEAIARG